MYDFFAKKNLTEEITYAERCVDPFHVIEWAMDSLDDVRVEAWRNAREEASSGKKAKRGRPKKGTPPKSTTVSEIILLPYRYPPLAGFT